ncbi:D-alanyl-D-alanine carboxypeptidase family protein [Hoeflea sp.]|uniref:D-alanyl-D-alanine carboxypeptidase family protein n=1 Tax=Hoeflea sp. TaxID=1940281 RepID=UPI003A91BF28
MNLLSQMRRTVAGLTLLGLALLPALQASAEPKIVVDAASGRVIEHEQAFQRWYPASLTKIMTAYVTFRAVKSGQMTLDTPITMSARAAKEKPSKMYFKPGERFPLDSALKFLLVKSANDVAVALAEAVSGSEEAFVAEMNATALRLGMRSTRFINPNGMPGEGQYTTAHDLALLAIAVRRDFPEFQRYFAYEGFAVGNKAVANYNLLIGRFDGANGMKTGFICASGFNQVSSATRNGKTAISVVLGAPSQEARADESARLLQEALTTPALGSPTLSTLAPYGEGRDVVADISGEICTPEARAKRYDGRDVNGKLVFKSPYIVAMTREPRLAQAPMSPSLKPSEVALSRIPIPTPRPLDTLAGSEAPFSASGFTTPAAAAETMPLRPAKTVPVPVPRPEI